MKKFALSLLFWGLAITALAEVRTGAYYDCLWEGTQELRLEDTPKLIDAGFDLFVTPITAKAVDPTSLDSKFLDTCKASNVKVIAIPNTIQPAQYKTLVERYPEVLIGVQLKDDANFSTPAEITAVYNTWKPFLAGTQAYITVAKNADHSKFGPLVPWYHVQTYLGKAVTSGDGMKRFAYDEFLKARAAVPATGKLFGAGYLGKSTTPHRIAGGFGERDPVWRSREFSSPYIQEAVLWLQLMAGADHLASYTAFSVLPAFPSSESRLAERWDLLPAWKQINAKIKSYDRYLSGGVRTTRVDGKNCIGEWKLPTGEKLVVTVDLTSEFYPRVDWQEIVPMAPPTAIFRINASGGVDIRGEGIQFQLAP